MQLATAAAPAPAATFNKVAHVQQRHLEQSIAALQSLQGIADEMRHVINNEGDTGHIQEYIAGKVSAAQVHFEAADDLQGAPTSARFRDIDARSAMWDGLHLVQRAIVSDDFTPLGKARAYGAAADELVGAVDAVRAARDVVASQVRA